MIPLFVELCAGTAAVSLRLHRDGARPPVSRMGAKTGYADTILRVLGLVPGQRAAAYLWCEPDPGVRLLLEAYRDATLAKAAAAIIRSWAGEEPRALWERLRAEGPPRGPTADEVARWSVGMVWTVVGMWPNSGFCGPGHVSKAGKVPFPSGTTFQRHVSARLGATPTLPATIHPDARQVDPREVARWSMLRAWSVKSDESYFRGPAGMSSGEHLRGALTIDGASDRFDALPTVNATITDDARAVDPGPSLPPGTVVYADPPYVGTTGYASDLPRAEVVDLARRWAAAGATVAISEAEALPELVAEGWHAVRIDGERVGQKRTFSRQQAEWLTMNAAPAWRPAIQGGLFGGAR